MSCAVCLQPKIQRNCDICDKGVCKKCIRYLEREMVQFHPEPPKSFCHDAICEPCFEANVATELAHYQEIEKAAEEVIIVRKTYRWHIPILRRAKFATEVKNHTDKHVAVRHLQFLAAWNGFDSLVEFDVDSKKIRLEAWETHEWHARGVFACLDKKKFKADPEWD